MNIRFVCCCRPRYLIGSGSNRRCLIMTLMKSRWRAVGFPSAPWYEIFSFVSRLKWTVEFVEVWHWTSLSAAQSEGAVWLLHLTPPWLSDCCQNVNVYTARPSFRLYRRCDSIIQVSQLCLDVFFSPPCLCREKRQLLWPEAFVRADLFVWEWEWIGKIIPEVLSFLTLLPPLKKVESASPSLWKFLTTPSWRIMTKPSNSCWKRTTRGQSSSLPAKKTYGEGRSTILASSTVLGRCWWLAMFRSLISE